MKLHCIKIEALAFVLVSLFVFGALSCSSHSEGSSMATLLDSVDRMTAGGDSREALKALKKAERRAVTAYDKIGIYKRYMVLGEAKSAEKLLKKSLKKLTGNEELSAVYSNFLLRRDRLDEACEVARCLEKSKYSSIYSECFLRKKLSEMDPSAEKKEFFSLPEFIPVYESAWYGSGDSLWIFNAASLLMKNGEFEKAVLLYPTKLYSERDCLFWGCVFFDSGLYAESLKALGASQQLASFSSVSPAGVSTEAEIYSLMADSYYVCGEESKSEECRDKVFLLECETPAVLMNSALYEKRRNNHELWFSRLHELTQKFPSFVPGIAGYADYALEQEKDSGEDELLSQLRDAGFRTIGMEARDSIPKVTFGNVFERIDFTSVEESSPELVVLRTEMENRISKLKEKGAKVSGALLWKTIEENSEEKGCCPPVLARYVLSVLVEDGFVSEARSFFDSYTASKGPVDYSGSPEDHELWELEFYAWFSALDGRLSDSMKVYEYIASRYGSRSWILESQSKKNSVLNAFSNLSVIYSAIDKADKALEMLNLASSKTVEPKAKSEFLYRTAELEWKMGSSRNAVRSLKYALSLNPRNNKAHLLMKKIRSGESEK